ncbi:MAG: thiamine pyrophosphate-binding protein [Polyangiaceae bacterium]
MLTLARIDTQKARPLALEDAPSLADQLVKSLAAAGITQYFGVPGGAIEPLFNALSRQQRAGAIRLTPTRSEAGAAFAADGYFRATQQMAVCTATTGPGTTNLITAVMSAHADRIPMLVLTPQVTSSKQGRGALQDSSSDGYDLERILAECTRYSSHVTHPEQLPHKLARALSKAWGSPGGPVHLSFSSDLLAAKPLANPLSISFSRPTRAPVDEVALRLMVEELLCASAPVLYVGDDAGPEAERILSVGLSLGARVVASPAGKRWISHTHRAYRGVLGFSGNPEASRAVAGSDLIVAFGATFDELSTNAWSVLPASVPLFSVDTHDCHAYRLPHARAVVAPLGRTLDEVEACLPSRAQQKALNSMLPPAPVRSSEDGAVHPADLMRWLSQELPPDVVVHVDAGNGFSWSTRDLVRPQPDTYRVAMGAASMCWAIGAAIGAAIGNPRRTLCVCGDGSMLMSSLELTVAVEQKLPVTYLVLNDSSLGMVRHGQRLAGAEPVGFEIAAVRFDRLARACGARGQRVNTLGDLQRIPRAWLASDKGGPALIDVRIDRGAVPPMADRVLGLAMGVPK